MKYLEKYTKQVNEFIRINGHEPTAIDFDTNKDLPSSRTIQRSYGGLPKFRELLGLKIKDFTKGEHRSKKAKQSMDDCYKDETKLFLNLLKKYGEEKVSSPARVFLNNGVTADFRLITKEATYLIDVFKPNTIHSFRSCIHIKNKKYLVNEQSFYNDPIKFLYVCVNEDVFLPIKNEIEVISLSEFKKRFL